MDPQNAGSPGEFAGAARILWGNCSTPVPGFISNYFSSWSFGLGGGWGVEQVAGAAGDEVGGDAVAEGGRVDLTQDVLVELDHGLAIGGDHLGVDAVMAGAAGCGAGAFDRGLGERLVAGDVNADGELAAAAEGVEGNALGSDGEAGLGVIEEGEGFEEERVAGGVGVGRAGMARGAGFERKSALAGCRADLLGGEAGVDRLGAAETVETGGGEDEGVTLALGEFAQAGVDVAANLDEADVGAEGEELSAAARAGGADRAVVGQGVQAPVGLADPDVAGVDAGRDGGQGELRGEGGGEILEGVNSEVDATFGEGLLDLLDEDAFAVCMTPGREAGRSRAAACGRRWCG